MSISNGRALESNDENKFREKVGEVGDVPRREIEDRVRWGAHPFAKITSIGKRDAARHNAGFVFRLFRDIPGTRDDDLVCRSHLTADQLNLICNK
jgi:hypothetical protein